jgi:hypothetical protein
VNVKASLTVRMTGRHHFLARGLSPQPPASIQAANPIAAATSPPHLSSPQPLFTSSILQSHISIVAHIMQLTTLLLAAIGAASVSASPSWVPSGGQVVINEDWKVPGDNPLYFCSDPKDDIAQIKKVDLSPNPPVPYVCPLCFQV